MYRTAYHEDNGSYPEIAETEFLITSDGADLQCVLPCSHSSECDCLTNWDVTPMSDVNQVIYKICIIIVNANLLYQHRYL